MVWWVAVVGEQRSMVCCLCCSRYLLEHPGLLLHAPFQQVYLPALGIWAGGSLGDCELCLRLIQARSKDGFLLKDQFPWPNHITPPLLRASGSHWIAPVWMVQASSAGTAGDRLVASSLSTVGATGGVWPALLAQWDSSPRAAGADVQLGAGLKPREEIEE